jgi:opacity protein-like surface antigen
MRPEGEAKMRWRGFALVWLVCCAPAVWAEAGDDEGYARRGFYIEATAALGDEDFKADYEGPIFADVYEKFPVGGLEPGESEADRFARVVCCSLSTQMNVGFTARLGYRLHPRLAVETEVNWMNPWDLKSEADFSSNIRDEVPFSGNIRVEPIVVTANAKFYLLTGRFQPYVSVGNGVYFLDIEDKGLGLRNRQLPQTFQQFSGRPRDLPERPPGTDLSVEDWGYTLRFRGGVEYYATEHLAVTFGVSYVLPMAGRPKDFDFLTYDVFGLQYRF